MDSKNGKIKKKYIKFKNNNPENIKLSIQEQRMINCSHIFVLTSNVGEWDDYRDNPYISYYCIKCGLDTKYRNNNSEILSSPIQNNMIDIYRKTARNGVLINCICNSELAEKIYREIITNNPNISDKDLSMQFKTIHYNIVQKNMNNRSKTKRLIKPVKTSH